MERDIRNLGIVICGSLINVLLAMLAVMKDSEAGLWLLVASTLAAYVAHWASVDKPDDMRVALAATLACFALTATAAVFIAFA